MFIESLPIQGAYLIKIEKKEDERGFFARTFCAREFSSFALHSNFVQTNISANTRAGTVRGLHFQKPPYQEIKLVRCFRGAIFDVIVDLREGSSTFRQWYGTELSEENGLAMYVPKGFAHGYQTLENQSTISYMVSTFYQPEYEGGYRFNDPAFQISWPLPVSSISKKDASLPLCDN